MLFFFTFLFIQQRQPVFIINEYGIILNQFENTMITNQILRNGENDGYRHKNK